MRRKKLMDYVDEFIKNGEVQGKCFFNGDYKKGNKAYAKNEKILQIAINDENRESFYSYILNKTNDPNTLTNCCAHMMKLNIYPTLARESLEELIRNKTINGMECHPIFISHAKLFLQEWDKGNIKPIIKD